MYRFVLSAFCLTFLIVPFNAVSAYFVDTDDWFSLPHPKVISFSIDSVGNGTGFVEGDIPFRQYTIIEEADLRIQRFEIENHFHYIVNGTIVYSVTELSALLSQNPTKEVSV